MVSVIVLVRAMKIRTKLFLSMSALIVFIMLCLLAVTQVQFYIYRDLSYGEHKIVFDSLRDEFERYYAEHNQSWEGVGTGNFDHSRYFAEIVLVSNGQSFYQKGNLSVDDLRAQGYPLVLYDEERKIGRLYVMNDKQLKAYEFKTIWYGFLPNIAKVSLLFTGVAAAVTIFLLSWRMTSPIRKIIKGIGMIKRGETEVVLPVRRKDEFGAIARALQEMNESLASLERSRKQLLSDVAHELKTPLMIMQGELEMAQDSGAGLSPAKLSSLLDEVLRLTRLVHDVLDLSKLEAGRTELRRRTENIAEMIEDLIEKVRFLAEDKQIALSLQVDQDARDVFVEKHRIVQALYNILVNSLHYTAQEGEVQVRVERIFRKDRQEQYVRISIEDNGSGIPQDDLPYIFDRFYRTDDSRSRHGGGTGLGLAIAKQNILAHEGWIEVQSEVGKGSAFSVYLPLPVSEAQ